MELVIRLVHASCSYSRLLIFLLMPFILDFWYSLQMPDVIDEIFGI